MVVKHIVRWEIDIFEKKLGRKLCPIALLERGMMVAFADSDGKVYVVDEEVLYFASENISDIVYIACEGGKQLSYVLDM